MRNRLLLGLSGLILVAAVGILCFRPLTPRTNLDYGRVIGTLPTTYPGWETIDQEVASTPEMKTAVTQMLNYDQAILREFRRGDTQILLYVAYWKGGKFPARLVAQHTPEVCWPGSGWTQLEAHYNQKLLLGDGTPALPVQAVTFEKGQRPYNVWYWHIVNGQLSGFASGPQSGSLNIFDSFWRDMHTASGEQMFIRISCNKQWPEIERYELVRELLIRLAPVLRMSK